MMAGEEIKNFEKAAQVSVIVKKDLLEFRFELGKEKVGKRTVL